jgi:hypothetical protein
VAVRGTAGNTNSSPSFADVEPGEIVKFEELRDFGTFGRECILTVGTVIYPELAIPEQFLRYCQKKSPQRA